MRIHELAAHGLEKVGHHGFVAAMGVPRQQLPTWDDIQFVTARARAPSAARRRPGRHRSVHRAERAPAALPRHPVVRLGHVVRRALARGEDRARARRAARGHRHLLGRGRHAARGAGRELALLLRARVGAVRLVVGRVEEGAGVPLQARPGREDRVPAVTCPARRSSAASPRCATCPKARPRSRRRRSPTGTESTTSAASPTRCASVRTASRSAPSSRRSTSRPTSTPRSRSASTTSSSTVAAAVPARRRCCSATTSRSRRSPRSRARAGISITRGRRDVTLVITGGLRDAADFAKALALGADAVAIANSAIQAIGCLGMRACHTDNCPVGIATQKPHLRARLPVDEASQRLARFLRRDGRAHGGARARVRARSPAQAVPRRPHDVRPRHGRRSPASRTEASVPERRRPKSSGTRSPRSTSCPKGG